MNNPFSGRQMFDPCVHFCPLESHSPEKLAGKGYSIFTNDVLWPAKPSRRNQPETTTFLLRQNAPLYL
jgi:hypothetical protein